MEKVVRFKKPYINLSHETVEAILKAIEESERISKELGFAICGDREKNYPGPVCIGGQCDIPTLPECKDVPTIGFFHTHPTGKGKPSPEDLSYWLKTGKRGVLCVGGRNEVCCAESTEKPERLSKEAQKTVEDFDTFLTAPKRLPYSIAIAAYEGFYARLSKFFEMECKAKEELGKQYATHL